MKVRQGPPTPPSSTGYESPAASPREGAARRISWPRSRLASPLTWRILAVNLVAPVILVGGLFYLDQYKRELIGAELESLRLRAEMVAAAIGEGAVVDSGYEVPTLSRRLARQMVRRLSPHARVRSRLYGADGSLLADSRALLSSSTAVQVEELPKPSRSWLTNLFRRVYNFATAVNLIAEGLPAYHERMASRARDYPEVVLALTGEPSSALRADRHHHMVLSTAVPVQHYKQVLGVLLVTATGEGIARNLFEVRLAIFEAFAIALGVTILLSVYLGGTIARPVRHLALAAERVRRGQGRRHAIPDLTARHDEIGDLSGALRDMTGALWSRMDAIEAFAADVAHEIKNPLTSLSSAVETVVRVTDPAQRDKLIAIIMDDVVRLDRLINDISDASRIDAELSRADTDIVALRPMLEAVAGIYRETGAAEGISMTLEADAADPLTVKGIGSRLGQVLRNLIANAISFSPRGGTIVLRGWREGGRVLVAVEDEGPGIPEGKLEAIFDRFYSERPKTEKFGTHSGLGLSISRQIVAAHGGTVTAVNRCDSGGNVLGARFTVDLPAADRYATPASHR